MRFDIRSPFRSPLRRFFGERPTFRRIALVSLAASSVVGLVAAAFLIAWLLRLDAQIAERFAGKRFAPPVEFYSAPELAPVGSRLPKDYLENAFARRRYRARQFGQPLQPSDYSVWTGEQCRSGLALPPEISPQIAKCVAFRSSLEADPTQIAALDSQGRVVATFAGSPLQPSPGAAIEPELFAQYYGGNATMRTVVPLGAVPSHCINALIAIEDSGFWDHSGVSLSSLARAGWVFLRSGHASQGGSTLTQQLVKNYFLTAERTFSRKATEFAMSLLLEARQSKPDILETYINLIYMGKNGSFQVRGWGAAADHYFGRDVQELTLPQCALLAAIVNSPGLFNPFTNPANALKRRAHVLDRMADLKMIEGAQAAAAKAAPLPNRPQRALTEPAPYFVQAVRRQLQQLGIDEADGLRAYTTLNLRAQEAAQQAVRAGLEHLETTVPLIKKLKEQGKRIEAALLAADPLTGHIQAVVGGRSFGATQFNRAFDSHRQVGSVMKPFTYLASLEATGEDGKPYGPLTILKDDPFTYKYQGQSWSPRNYEGKHFGQVPMYFALKESLNAATAQLGIAIGLGSIVDLSRRMGVQSKIEALPSLTLGAFELYPWEVLQAYGTISRFGNLVPLTHVARVESLDGRELFAYDPKPEQAVAPENMAILVGMMKQTLNNGSARGARLGGFTHPAAGKTGTTNDKKDAWFAGFTPYHTAVVWVGYDDNTPHGLSGGSGAVPIWTSYMKAYGASYPPDDFKWPDGAQAATISGEMLKALNVPPERGAEKDSLPAPIELVFRRGQAPEGAAVGAAAVPAGTAAPTGSF